MIGIYKITNPKGSVYIGQSIDIKKRFNTYKWTLASQQPKLNRSFVKYGFENHVFEIIIECEVLELNDKERYYQEIFNCLGVKGLNLCYVKSSDRNGFHSEETKLKISKNNARNNLGTKMSEEAKENLRVLNTGKKHSEETKLKISNSNKGIKKPISEETKHKISQSLKGRILSPERIDKLRVKQSEETVRKRKESISLFYKNNVSKIKGVKQSKENILKRIQGQNKNIILDLNTGIFYFSITEVSFVYNIKKLTLWRYLKNKTTNKTNLKIV